MNKPINGAVVLFGTKYRIISCNPGYVFNPQPRSTFYMCYYGVWNINLGGKLVPQSAYPDCVGNENVKYRFRRRFCLCSCGKKLIGIQHTQLYSFWSFHVSFWLPFIVFVIIVVSCLVVVVLLFVVLVVAVLDVALRMIDVILVSLYCFCVVLVLALCCCCSLSIRCWILIYD